MERSLVTNAYLRVAYVCEFWLVLLCIHVVWPQAGGQGHLDIMMWYWKLFLPILLAACVVGMTAAAASGEYFWSRKTVVWFVLTVVLGLAMIGVTYYYHLHENDGLETGAPEETAALTGEVGPCEALWEKSSRRQRWRREQNKK
jgi:heme/copper-type cytochrome/quinol oxidase subunit 3